MAKDYDETARELVASEVRYCVSHLISELLKSTGERDSLIDDDEATALTMRAPDSDDMRDALPSRYTVEQGTDPSDGATAWRWFEQDEDEGPPAPEDSDWFETEAEALADLYESENLDPPDGSEVFEHWLVTDWFGEKLRAKGETVAEVESLNLTVWGRCTSGQAIYCDGVIQAIAGEVHRARHGIAEEQHDGEGEAAEGQGGASGTVRRDNVEYHAGKAARASGEELSACPYSEGGERAARWTLGWQEGEG